MYSKDSHSGLEASVLCCDPTGAGEHKVNTVKGLRCLAPKTLNTNRFENDEE